MRGPGAAARGGACRAARPPGHGSGPRRGPGRRGGPFFARARGRFQPASLQAAVRRTLGRAPDRKAAQQSAERFLARRRAAAFLQFPAFDADRTGSSPARMFAGARRFPSRSPSCAWPCSARPARAGALPQLAPSDVFRRAPKSPILRESSPLPVAADEGTTHDCSGIDMKNSIYWMLRALLSAGALAATAAHGVELGESVQSLLEYARGRESGAGVDAGRGGCRRAAGAAGRRLARSGAAGRADERQQLRQRRRVQPAAQQGGRNQVHADADAARMGQARPAPRCGQRRCATGHGPRLRRPGPNCPCASRPAMPATTWQPATSG